MPVFSPQGLASPRREEALILVEVATSLCQAAVIREVPKTVQTLLPALKDGACDQDFGHDGSPSQLRAGRRRTTGNFQAVLMCGVRIRL